MAKSIQAKKGGANKIIIGIVIVVFCSIVAFIICLATGVIGKKNTASNKSEVANVDTAEKQKAEADFVDGEIVDYEKAGFLKLGTYSGLSIDTEPTEEDIEYEIEAVCSEHAVTENHVVKKGDSVMVNYVGKINGEEFDSNEEVVLTVGDYEYLEEFEDCMIGKNVGQTVKTSVTFPEDYGDEMLNGQTTQFEIEITGYVPEFNDEFVKRISKEKYKTVSEYKEKIKADLREGNVESLDESAWEKIKEEAKMNDIPEDLLEKSRTDTEDMYANFAEFQGATVDELLESFGMTEDDVEEMAKDLALDRMIARTIASKENLKLEDAYYKKELADLIEIDEDEVEKTSIEDMEEQYRESQSQHPKDDVMVEFVKDFIAGKSKAV